jgi:hypothetical protein
MLVVAAVFVASMVMQNNVLADLTQGTNEKQLASMTGTTTAMMDAVIVESMDRQTELEAVVSDQLFHDRAVGVQMVGDYAGKLLENADEVPHAAWQRPDASHDGELFMKVLFKEGLSVTAVEDKLGVIANFTPWWHSDDPALNTPILGYERARKQLRCKTLWDTGALVTWSSDNVSYGDFMTWSPYLGMEVGMTRWINEKTAAPEYTRVAAEYPPAEEKMGIEEMLLGYTINGAGQLGVEDVKGSIKTGKDADFLVFDVDLLTAEPQGFSHNKPAEVYFGGKKMN